MNRERLEHAYAIIDGIPDEAFNLQSWTTKEGRRLDCGTICCAAGWLARHPDNIADGFHMARGRYFESNSHPAFKKHTGYHAIGAFYGIPNSVAFDLFGPRISGFRAKHAHWTDKQIWLERVRRYLETHA